MSLTFNKNQLPSAPVDVLNQSNNMNYGQREKKNKRTKTKQKVQFRCSFDFEGSQRPWSYASTSFWWLLMNWGVLNWIMIGLESDWAHLDVWIELIFGVFNSIMKMRNWFLKSDYDGNCPMGQVWEVPNEPIFQLNELNRMLWLGREPKQCTFQISTNSVRIYHLELDCENGRRATRVASKRSNFWPQLTFKSIIKKKPNLNRAFINPVSMTSRWSKGGGGKEGGEGGCS